MDLLIALVIFIVIAAVCWLIAVTVAKEVGEPWGRGIRIATIALIALVFLIKFLAPYLHGAHA